MMIMGYKICDKCGEYEYIRQDQCPFCTRNLDDLEEVDFDYWICCQCGGVISKNKMYKNGIPIMHKCGGKFILLKFGNTLWLAISVIVFILILIASVVL